VEQRILWRAQKPWSKESYGGIKNHGTNNSMNCSELWSKEFCGLLKAMEKIIA
jgi:hypothetical protein